jgi:hypothetical protein
MINIKGKSVYQNSKEIINGEVEQQAFEELRELENLNNEETDISTYEVGKYFLK